MASVSDLQSSVENGGDFDPSGDDPVEDAVIALEHLAKGLDAELRDHPARIWEKLRELHSRDKAFTPAGSSQLSRKFTNPPAQPLNRV